MPHTEVHVDELFFRLINSLKDAPDLLKQPKAIEDLGSSITAEQEIGSWFLGELRRVPNLRINIRRRKAINTPSTTISDQRYRVCIDPLDGASHYYQAGHTYGLSHVACVTVLKQNGAISRFSDIIAGAIVELRTGDLWKAIRTEPVKKHQKASFRVTVNNKPFNSLSHTKLDLKKMTIFATMHNAKDRELIKHAFGDNWGMIRSHGSGVSEIMSVTSGQAAACIIRGLSHYSQGASFPLLKGSGCVIVDSDGNEIDKNPFDLKLNTSVVIAANQSIADQILERIHRP